MGKKILCFAMVIGLIVSLSACKAKQGNNSSKTVGYVSSTSDQSSDGYTSSNTASNSASGSSSTSSGKTVSGSTSSRRVVSHIPDPVTTNTVVISGNKVIQTVALSGETQVFTYTFSGNKVSSGQYVGTFKTEQDAQWQLANLEGTNRAVKLYDNLAANGKVVTANLTKAMLNDYLSYNQAGLKKYLEGLTY